MRAVLLLFLVLFGFTSLAQITLPRLISDGMVLQRDTKIKLWGWAAPNEKVTLQFSGKEYHTTSTSEGKWIITLPKQKSGGPFEMTFSASNKIQVKNILFGDVWLCSGQSNMELPMERVQDKYPDVIASANSSEIRQFLVPDKYDFEKPAQDVADGTWISVNRETIFKFSAVAYFFADELYSKYKIPIGLINSALGGSPAESWISEDSVKKFPEYYQELLRFKDKKLIEQIEAGDRKKSSDWFALLNQTDQGVKEHWATSNLNDETWQSMNIPGYWADGSLGNMNGTIWFRKEFVLPKSMIDQPAKLLLGRIVDADSVFVNGSFAGTTSYLYPPRRYLLKANVLKEGKNVIAIRVINSAGKGGFVLDKPYCLIVGKDSVSLKGQWKFNLGAKMNPLSGSTAVRWKPVGLYNAMIAPLTNYAIKGVIWYQGEANTKKPSEYFSLMRTLISDWRSRWGVGDFPFLFVQLANFMETKNEPAESNWAALRQAQLQTLQVKNTGMAVAIDLGEWNDIHPLNKKEVGHRLALQARQIAYGEKKIIASGPRVNSIELNENKITLSFSNGNLTAFPQGNLKYFSIAGADRKFVWANAQIIGNKVAVWNENVQRPMFVRYAWADNPAGANLCNKELLPASPFEAAILEKSRK